MAIGYLEEFAELQRDSNGTILPIYGPPLAAQTVSFTATTEFGDALQRETRYIRFWADGACYFTIAAGTATATATTSATPALSINDRVVPFKNDGTLKVAALAI